MGVKSWKPRATGKPRTQLEAVSIFRASDLDGVWACRVWVLCHSASHSGPGEKLEGVWGSGFWQGSSPSGSSVE